MARVPRARAHLAAGDAREIAAGGAWDTAPLSAITAPALLLDGVSSPPHLRRSTGAIAAALPSSRIAELPGQGHGAPGTAPDLVAAAMHEPWRC